MIHQYTLISLARDHGGFRSFAALARAIGMDPLVMHRCRKSEVALTEEQIRLMAGFAGGDADGWVRRITAQEAARRRRGASDG